MNLIGALVSLVRTRDDRNHPKAIIELGTRIDDELDRNKKASARLAAAMQELNGVNSLVDLLGKH
jgi:hypothetical protein